MEMVGFHGNDLRQPRLPSSPPQPNKGRLWNVPASMKSYVTTGEAAPLLTPDKPIRSRRPGNYHICQVVHQRGCRWFTTPNADSWAHRLGINCTRGAQRREMSYALFSSGWNNQFLERSFVMETKHSVRRGIRGWGGGGGESKQLTSHKVIS